MNTTEQRQVMSERIAGFFDHKAASFDAIYSGRKSAFGKCWDRLTRRNIYSRLQFTLNAGSPWKGKRVLDAGCGSGRYGLELARQGAGEVVGIDVSGVMLETARHLAGECGLAQQCRFVQTEVIDFEDKSGFDVSIANGFFDYIIEPLPVLRHLCGLTRKTLIATFPTKWAGRTLFRWAWFKLHHCPIRFYTCREVRNLIEQCGFLPTTLTQRGPIILLSAEAPDNS